MLTINATMRPWLGTDLLNRVIYVPTDFKINSLVGGFRL